MLKIIYSNNNKDKRHKGEHAYRLKADDDLLNISNQMLKQSKNSIISNFQVQFLKILARSSRTASINRNTLCVVGHSKNLCRAIFLH